MPILDRKHMKGESFAPIEFTLDSPLEFPSHVGKTQCHKGTIPQSSPFLYVKTIPSKMGGLWHCFTPIIQDIQGFFVAPLTRSRLNSLDLCWPQMTCMASGTASWRCADGEMAGCHKTASGRWDKRPQLLAWKFSHDFLSYWQLLGFVFCQQELDVWVLVHYLYGKSWEKWINGGFRAYMFVCCLLWFCVGVQCFIFAFDVFSGGVLGVILLLKWCVNVWFRWGDNCWDCWGFCLCLGGDYFIIYFVMILWINHFLLSSFLFHPTTIQ